MTLHKDIPHFDIVHIHSIYTFHFGAASILCRRFGIPYVVRLHGILDPYVRNMHRFRKALHSVVIDRWALAGAAAVHFTAQEEMEQAVSAEGETGFRNLHGRGVVIPNGVDVDPPESRSQVESAIGSLLARFPGLRTKRIALFLGRVDHKKGLDIVADAFARVCKVRDDVQLIIAGPDNDNYGQQIHERLRALGVAGQATFTGILLGAEKAAAFRMAEVFLLPSYGENFAITVAEAMAAEVPVIISNRVNIWKDVEEAGAGLVIDCDAGQLSQALLQIIDNPEVKARMGACGRRLVMHSYSWQTVGEQTAALYRDLIETAPRTTTGQLGHRPSESGNSSRAVGFRSTTGLSKH